MDEDYEGNVEATGEDYSVELAESRRPFRALLDVRLLRTTTGNRVFGALKINMVRKGPGSYRLRMNDSEIEAEVHTLTDESILIQVDGYSHIIHAEEGVAGTRLLIEGSACLLQNDHDPSKLFAETPCKLLRYVVESGSHVNAETPYAEVELMKMCMPLVSPASGNIQFKKSEGQIIQAGELIARLELDDPLAVRTVKPFHGSFPVLRPPTGIYGKLHQQFAASLNAALVVLAGYEHN